MSYATISMPNISYLSLHTKLCDFKLTKGKKVGVVKQPALQPRSYIAEAEGKEYRRNRRHLLTFPELAPVKLSCPAATDHDVLSVPSSHVMPPNSQSPPKQVPAKQFKCLGWPCPATFILLLFETPTATLCLLASPNT